MLLAFNSYWSSFLLFLSLIKHIDIIFFTITICLLKLAISFNFWTNGRASLSTIVIIHVSWWFCGGARCVHLYEFLIIIVALLIITITIIRIPSSSSLSSLLSIKTVVERTSINYITQLQLLFFHYLKNFF